MMHKEIENWFHQNPDITQIVAGIFDFNGVLRAKRVPVGKLSGLLCHGMKMPHSIQLLDIFGEDIEGSDLVFESGDQDGTAFVTGRLPMRLSFLQQPSALVILSFGDLGDGSAPAISPHQMLARHQAAHHNVLLTCGVEMEFCLLTANGTEPAPSLATNERMAAGQILSALQLDDYDALLAQISDLCNSQSIAIDTITSEAGVGQFEVTFQPKSDLCQLAEDILVFKYLVKALAKSFGIKASFMAKPVEDQPGNGMHVHASLCDKNTGANLFDDANNGPEAKARLQSAIAGLLGTMKEASLILAPMMNSYRRLVASSHAPVNLCWGYDNRTAAIRVPASPPEARRLELRVPGADANPYFLLAWLSASMRAGIDQAQSAPPPVSGNAYEQSFERLAEALGEALLLASGSAFLQKHLDEQIWQRYIETKTQEYKRFSAHISALEFTTLSEQL